MRVLRYIGALLLALLGVLAMPSPGLIFAYGWKGLLLPAVSVALVLLAVRLWLSARRKP